MADLPGLPADPSDGSMETILASIRRIIREDEGGAAPAAVAEEDELLVLQPSMLVQPISTAETEMPVERAVPASTGTRSAAELAASLFDDDPEPVAIVAVHEPPAPAASPAPLAPLPAAFDPAAFAIQSLALQSLAEPRPQSTHPAAPAPEIDPAPLLAPATRAAAAQSLAALQDAVRPEPTPAAALRLLRSGGPTIEDMVREELRGQLKEWLDANLPALVERVVRQEIEQLVQRPV